MEHLEFLTCLVRLWPRGHRPAVPSAFALRGPSTSHGASPDRRYKNAFLTKFFLAQKPNVNPVKRLKLET